MSKEIGDRLPWEILAALDGEDLERKIGPAYLLLSADPDGTPRPCMLSAGELLAVDERRLRVALWPGTRTAANLGRGGTAVFCYVAPRSVLYARGTVTRLASSGPLECFEVAILSVESDEHVGMPVTDGIRFASERDEPPALVDSWRKQLEPLRVR